MQLTETKLKQKYLNSSKKIKHLKNEFESLKSHIYISQRKSKEHNFFIQSQHSNTYLKTQSDDLSYYTPQLPQYTHLQTQNSNIKQQTQFKTFLRNSLQMFLFGNMKNLQRKIYEKCRIMDNQMSNLCDLQQLIKRLIKVRSNNLKNQIKCNCKWKGVQIKQVQQKYEQYIKQLKASYENKINFLIKDNDNYQTMDSSTNDLKSQNNLKENFQKLQQKMFIKQKEITELKTQISQLRRKVDHSSRILREKQKLIEELGLQIKEKQTFLKDLNLNVKLLEQNSEAKIQQIKKYHQINSTKLMNEIENLKQVISNLEMQASHNRIIQKFDLKDDHKEKEISLNFEKLSQKEEVLSDFEESYEQIISNQTLQRNININQISLRYSLMQYSPQMKTYKLQNKIRQLQSQLFLLNEENILLRGKKDKFEEQVKQNQDDQVKFQMQSQILREEVKRLNLTLKILDECAVLLLKEHNVPKNKLQVLDDKLEFKRELIKVL